MCQIKVQEFVPKSGMTSLYMTSLCTVMYHLLCMINCHVFVGVKIDTTEAEAAASANATQGGCG